MTASALGAGAASPAPTCSSALVGRGRAARSWGVRNPASGLLHDSEQCKAEKAKKLGLKGQCRHILETVLSVTQFLGPI